MKLMVAVKAFGSCSNFIMKRWWNSKLTHMRVSFSTSNKIFNQTLEGKVDRHNGVVVDAGQIPADVSEEGFLLKLQDSVSRWKSDSRRAVWLNVPMMHSKYIPIAARCGFVLHHCDQEKSVMTLWLDQSTPDRLPDYATHQIGVAGIAYRPDTKQVLLVQDANQQFNLWKFPGGVSNLGEDIGETAVREIREETGIETEFQSILAFRQQHNHPGAFGRSNIFVVCRMTPLTFDIRPCAIEIQAACWMTLSAVENSPNVAPVLLRLTRLFSHGLANGFDSIDIVGKGMKSIYKGLKYNLYHRPFMDLQAINESEHEDRYEVCT